MKLLALLTACAVSLGIAQPAAAQSYPTKPVRIVVPYQPGQGTDVATRFLAEHLSRTMGQSFVVENRPGAGGNIGAAEVARAAPDGYTLLMGTNGTHVLNQYLYDSMPFDPEKDFVPVMMVSSFPMAFLVQASSPHHSLSDLLSAAKSRPGTINVALPSTTARLVLERMKQQTGSDLKAIPYKGSGTSMTELIGGQVDVAIDTVSSARPFLASGKLRALAVTSLQATALLPSVRTVAAQGVEGFQVVAWNGLYAPRGTPPAVVQKLNTALVALIAQPEVRQRLLDLGHEPVGGPPGDLGAFARSERQKWAPLISQTGLKAD